jgi:hypothetical protein
MCYFTSTEVVLTREHPRLFIYRRIDNVGEGEPADECNNHLFGQAKREIMREEVIRKEE